MRTRVQAALWRALSVLVAKLGDLALRSRVLLLASVARVEHGARSVAGVILAALEARRQRAHDIATAKAEQTRALWEICARLEDLVFQSELLTSQLGAASFNAELLFDERVHRERRAAHFTSSMPPPPRPSLSAGHLAAIAEVKGNALPKPPPIPHEMMPSRRPRSGIIHK